MKRIAYPRSQRDAFSHHVVQTAFPKRGIACLCQYHGCYQGLWTGSLVDYSVVPVENSIEGSVHESLDYLFHQARIQAVANRSTQNFINLWWQFLVILRLKIFPIHSGFGCQGKKFIDKHSGSKSRWLLVPPTRPALFRNIQTNLLQLLPRAARVWFGIDVKMSRNGRFHTF